MSENTELATIQAIGSAPVGSIVCSIKPNPNDRETSARIYNAMNNPTHRIAEYINKEIAVVDYLIEIAEIENEETGIVSTVPRVVLIDDAGESYQAVSIGMANAVRNLVIACGDAPWHPPVDIRVKQTPTKNGSMLTVEML